MNKESQEDVAVGKGETPKGETPKVAEAKTVSVDSVKMEVTETVKFYAKGNYFKYKLGQKITVSKNIAKILLDRNCAKKL